MIKNVDAKVIKLKLGINGIIKLKKAGSFPAYILYTLIKIIEVEMQLLLNT